MSTRTKIKIVVAIAMWFLFLLFVVPSPASALIDEGIAHKAVQAGRSQSPNYVDRCDFGCGVATQAVSAATSYEERSQSYTYRQQVYADGGNKNLRKQIESGGDYSTNTGNGYLGAYQFSERYVQGWAKEAGIEWRGVEDFLNSKEKQDALADWYANARYGGWHNVPTSGGW